MSLELIIIPAAFLLSYALGYWHGKTKTLDDIRRLSLAELRKKRIKRERIFFSLIAGLIILVCLNVGLMFYLWGQV